MIHLGKGLLTILCLIVCFLYLLLGNEGIAQTSVPTPTDGVLPTPSRTPYVDYYVEINASPGGTVDGVRGHASYFAYPGISFYNISIIPDIGYKILDVTDNGVSLGAIKTYNLINVQTSHVINGTFVIESTLMSPSTSTISPTPTAPELPWFSILPLLLGAAIVMALLKKKSRDTNNT